MVVYGNAYAEMDLQKDNLAVAMPQRYCRALLSKPNISSDYNIVHYVYV